jgi:hypothetical protein
MISKELLSLAAILVTFAMFLPYIGSIRQGRTKPHVFSWVIWALGTFVVFLAQLAGGAGVGAWAIGVSSVITLYIAWLAYVRRTDLAITRSDWFFLAAALSALPFWYLTADPLWAVVILTAVDLAGFGPTYRSAWVRPFSEHPGFFALGAVRNVLVILALEHYSVTTVLFPAAVGAGCVVLVLLIVMRRRSVARPATGASPERSGGES